MRTTALILPLFIAADLPGQTRDTPDPRELLRAARQACLSVPGARYRARYEEFGERHRAGFTVCEVTLARPAPGSGLGPRFAVHGTRSHADRPGPVPLHAGFDGSVVRRLVAGRREVRERRFDDLAPGQEAWTLAAGELGAGGNGAVLWSLLVDDPLRRELAAQNVEYEGRAYVGEVWCEVLYFPGSEPHEGDRLFLGIDDHLPRKREHISVMYTDRVTGSVLTVTELDVVEPPDGSFTVAVPEGYTVAPYEPPVRDEALLPVGAPAPDWTLRDPDGEPRRLSDLRGKVVVLDFWGTWCGPCVRKLPDLQALADALRDAPVEVLALSCHEPVNARPRELMDRHGCHVPVLLNGETVCEAYGVTTFPTVYVVGVDGEVLFRAVGGAPPGELEELVRAHLDGRRR